MALLVLLLVVFRIVGSVFPETVPNFQPLAALFFCGALMAMVGRAGQFRSRRGCSPTLLRL